MRTTLIINPKNLAHKQVLGRIKGTGGAPSRVVPIDEETRALNETINDTITFFYMQISDIMRGYTNGVTSAAQTRVRLRDVLNNVRRFDSINRPFTPRIQTHMDDIYASIFYNISELPL